MNTTSRMLVALITVAAALIALPIFGDDPDRVSESTPIGGLAFVDQVDVTVVNVDVFVRDKKGRPITDLGVEDFVVTQDDVPMKITNFEPMTEEIIVSAFQKSPALPPRSEEAPPSDEDFEDYDLRAQIKPIWVVIYIDNENIHPMKRNRVLRRVREFVTDNLHEPVQMMVVSYQRSLRVLQPFTTDPKAVTSALRSVGDYTGGRIDRDSARQDIIDRMREEDVRDYGAQHKKNTSEATKSRMYQDVIHFANEELNILSFTLTSLRQVVETLSGLEGRKSLIYVSSGLPMVPGLGLMHEYSINYKDNSILSRRGRYDRTAAFRSLTSSANSQGVTLYTIDAEGLEVKDGISAESSYSADPTASSVGLSNYQSSLRYMARRTGGLATVNTNDVSAGLERIRDDLFSYYSIGYAVNNSGKDAVHSIEVKTPDHKDWKLRFRRRYVEKSLETKVQDRVMSALIFDVDDNPMQIRLEPGKPAPGTGNRWVMPMHISFPLRKLALLPRGDDLVGRVVLFLGARDTEGNEADIQRQEHEVLIPAAEYEDAARERFGIDLPLLMAEGQHRVVVGLLDPVTRNVSYMRGQVRIP